MATPAQINANRLNARKSTGPRSDEGKAASRFNALKHAASARSMVIPGEDETTLAELAAAWHEQFEPVGPEETLLVEKIVAADWMQRRMSRLEAEVFNTLIAQLDEFGGAPSRRRLPARLRGSQCLQKIFRRREAAGRECQRALRDLRDLQARRFDFEFAPPEDLPLPEAPRPVAAPQPRVPIPAFPSPEPQPQPPTPAVEPQLPPAARHRIGFVFDESTPPSWRL
jgi:hypothetical protein